MSPRRLVLPLAGLALLPAAAAPAAPLAPHLDPTYAGGAGMAIADFPTQWEEGRAIAPAPGGGAYVAGTGSKGELGTHVIAARFTEAGELDKTFSGDGRAVGIDGNVVDAGADAEGRVVLATQSKDEQGDIGFALTRLTAAGEPDTAYGKDGIAIVRVVDAPEPVIEAVHVDPDGSAIAVGSVFTWGGHITLIVRFDDTGKRVDMDIAAPIDDGEEMGVDVMRQPGAPAGTFVVASRLDRGDLNTTILTRHDEFGELDKTFGGGDGVVEAAIDGTAFATGPDGSLVIASGGSDLVYYERYDRDGTKLGEWHTDLGDSNALATGMAIQDDGKIVVSGRMDANTWVVRYAPSGALDETFGDKGVVLFKGRGEDLMLTAKGPLVGGSSTDRVMAARIGAGSTPTPPKQDPEKPKPEPEKPQPPAQEVRGDVQTSPPPPAVKVADLVRFPSARRCVSRRKFRIRLVERKGVKTVSAKVVVNGKQVSVVRGKRLRAPVDLRGLPKGRFKVKITLTLEDGRTISGTRKYRTCAKKRHGKKKIKV
jgi:uncharacterized delta-60 repeat protein